MSTLHFSISNTVITYTAILLFVIFLSLSIIHIYWGFGGKWGHNVVLPTKNNGVKVITPGALSTFTVAAGLLIFGFFPLITIGFIFRTVFPTWLATYGLWTIAAVFILRAIGDFNYTGFLKKINHTKFARNDTKYYSPLCLLISVLAIVLV
jgi:hypothetical protein